MTGLRRDAPWPCGAMAAGAGWCGEASSRMTGSTTNSLPRRGDLIRDRWRPEPAPEWGGVRTLEASPRTRVELRPPAGAVAGLDPAIDVVVKARDTEPQKTMQNSHQQYRNVVDAFEIRGEVPSGPVLLVDDMVDSRWTLTVVGSLLREEGAGPVLPFALADTGGRSDT